MSSESPPLKKSRSRSSTRSPGAEPPSLTMGLRVFDGVLLVAFLGLTFLLGAFPLKDTDFWWHLRTGDLIRQTGSIPRTDPYTFTVEGKPWIDLHWLFQVAVSVVYQYGGIPALTIAKCAITCVAVGLLVTARRREWPLWAMLLAWLPALLVLGGRMYVRPETLTLLYLAAFLAVLLRIDRLPRLAFVLPIVQVAWVNTQGLFVFGPVLLATSLVDASLRRGAFAPGRMPWWRIVGLATLLTGLACVLNPYGLTGALYPLQLARTMNNPIFSHKIAELTPIPEFIRRHGAISLPFHLHLLTMALGALSFLLPIGWVVWTRIRSAVRSASKSDSAGLETAPKGKDRSSRLSTRASSAATWRLSPFRLILFVAFSVLSWRATRNSHQFAAVVGTITAWNFGEWAWAMRRRAWERHGSDRVGPAAEIAPRCVALASIFVVFAWVASGQFYESSREGRTIGLGEQPLWYPHEAVKFSGRPGMPQRFLGFHIGNASLYEYYFGPERKVFVDARLEVIGADLFERYNNLMVQISRNSGSWARELDEMGRPVVVVDLENNALIGATLLTHPDWRCVWFDPVGAVFVHVAYTDIVDAHTVDFAARHFRPLPEFEPNGMPALLASSKGLMNMASTVARTAGPIRALPLILLGSDHARRAGRADPTAGEPWKRLGQLEYFRETPWPESVKRYRLPLDPVFDLSPLRATYAFRKALEAAPDDFMSLLLLIDLFKARDMNEEMLPLLDRLIALTPINEDQAEQQERAVAHRVKVRAALGPYPSMAWENSMKLTIANDLLTSGRVASAVDYFTSAVPDHIRSWEETDKVATMRLHLGQPGEARRLWPGVAKPPRPGPPRTRESR